MVDQGDADVKVRTYPTADGTYVGVAYKGYAGKSITINVPGARSGLTIKNLVTGETVSSTPAGDGLQFKLQCGPMELDAFLVK